jgi:hypothetical protein
MRMKSPRLRLAALPLALALALTGCGGDGDGGDGDADADADETSSSSASPGGSESPTTDPADSMTEPGSGLALRQPARFAWQPRAGVSGIATVAVHRLDQVPITDFSAFTLKPEQRQSTPYYVTVTVRNDGNTDLGGAMPPLYLDDGSDVLQPPVRITSVYRPCPSRGLPKGFTQGKNARLCLVFLAPPRTRLQSIVLRPNEDFDPITWTGAITRPVQAKKPAPKPS